MRLIKEDKIIIAAVLLLLCLHLAYVISSALPDNAANKSDTDNALPELQNRTAAVDEALMKKFSLLYGIEPAITSEQIEEVETEQDFSTMQPRLLAVNIENNITTVLVLVNENAQSKQYALKAGDELFSYTLVEANLRQARFESNSDSLTLNMFKSFVPAGTDEN